LRIKFLEKINLVSPIKMQIGKEVEKDKITYRPPNRSKSQDNPEPDIHNELPSGKDQGMFEELLVQQRGAFIKAIGDLEATIDAYKERIAKNETMIQEAKRKLEHIEGLMS